MFSGGDNSQMNGDMPHDGGGGGGHEVGDELKKTGKYAFIGSKLPSARWTENTHTIKKKDLPRFLMSAAVLDGLTFNLIFPTAKFFIIISRFPTYIMWGTYILW